MKNLIISCIILVILIGSIIFYGVYSHTVTSELTEFCSSDGIYSAEEVRKTLTYWESKRNIIHLGVNSSLTDNLSLAFTQHLASLETPMDEETEKTAEALRFHLKTLRDASLVSWLQVF